MAVITTGNFAKALWPGVNAWYGDEYNTHKTQWTELVDTESSERAYEEDVGLSGFGLPVVKAQGGSIQYDTEQQGFTTRYTPVVYAKGFMVDREAFDDDLYGIVGKKKAKGLAFAMRQGKEIVVTNIYNRHQTAGFTGGDGSILSVTTHANVAGGTWSNRSSTNAALAEASLEQAVIDIGDWNDDRGLKIALSAQKLVIPTELEFEANRILKSQYRVGTAENDINALNLLNKFPQGIAVNNYLTSSTAWFLKTNAQNGFKLFQRWDMRFDIDNDFDTFNAKFLAVERYSVGWTDPRCIYSSAGA